MLQPNDTLLLRVALTVACAFPLALQAPVEPAPLVSTIEVAPAAAAEAAQPSELEQLAALERAAPDLAGLRGGDVNLSQGETVLVVIGIVILVILIA